MTILKNKKELFHYAYEMERLGLIEDWSIGQDKHAQYWEFSGFCWYPKNSNTSLKLFIKNRGNTWQL